MPNKPGYGEKFAPQGQFEKIEVSEEDRFKARVVMVSAGIRLSADIADQRTVQQVLGLSGPCNHAIQNEKECERHAEED